MSQNNLNGLFLPAVAGLFFFMKRPKVKEIETVYPVYSRDPSGLTGVARYLANQEAIILAARNAKLLEDQKAVPLVSGVARYIQIRDQFPTSGVTKYVLRQTLVEKQKKQIVGEIEATGVDTTRIFLPAVLSSSAAFIANSTSDPVAIIITSG